MGKGGDAIEALENALIEAWDEILDRIFEQLADSMPYRVKALIHLKGSHIKY
jgi:hypothetical protein